MATVAPSRPRAGRNSEMGLLLLGLAVGLGAYVVVGLNLEGAIPDDLLRYAGTLVGLTVVVHLVLRWRAPNADPVILPLVVGLNGLGLAMIYRIDYSLEAAGRTAGFGERQLVWTIVGVVLAVAVLIGLRDHRTLRRYPFLSMVAGLVLLCLPMLPFIGREINGAQLWVGFGSLSFQPAEIAKILLAIFFAGYFVTRRDALTLAGTKMLGLQLPRFADLAPIVVIWLVSVGVLVLERDLGTSLLFFGLFVSMLYVATEKVSWIFIGLVLVAVGVVFAYYTFGYVQARFEIWFDAMDPEIYNRDPGGSGQLVRGLFGLAAGGLMGTGLGQGHPTLVPYANSDFIVASFGEELGLTGLIAILMLYLVLAQRGLRAAIGVRDGFGKLLAAGFAFVIAFQVFVVVGGVTRLIPLTGLTMPFLAAGGSSLVANWIIVAILLRISDGARRPAAAGAGSVVGNETALIALAGSGRTPTSADTPPRPSAFGWDNVDDDPDAPADDTFSRADTEYVNPQEDLTSTAVSSPAVPNDAVDHDTNAPTTQGDETADVGVVRDGLVGPSRTTPAAPGQDPAQEAWDGDDDNPTQVVKP